MVLILVLLFLDSCFPIVCICEIVSLQIYLLLYMVAQILLGSIDLVEHKRLRGLQVSSWVALSISVSVFSF